MRTGGGRWALKRCVAWVFCVSTWLVPALISRLILTLFLAGNLQSDPISEDEFMTRWNTAVGDTFISNASLNGKYPLPSSSFEALYNGRRNGETTCAHLIHFPCRTRQYPTSIVRNTSSRICRTCIAVGTKHLDKTSSYSSMRNLWWPMVYGASPMSWKRSSSLFSTLFLDSTVPCNHYLSLRPLF
jgi:hypothetical protein